MKQSNPATLDIDTAARQELQELMQDLFVKDLVRQVAALHDKSERGHADAISTMQTLIQSQFKRLREQDLGDKLDLLPELRQRLDALGSSLSKQVSDSGQTLRQDLLRLETECGQRFDTQTRQAIEELVHRHALVLNEAATAIDSGFGLMAAGLASATELVTTESVRSRSDWQEHFATTRADVAALEAGQRSLQAALLEAVHQAEHSRRKTTMLLACLGSAQIIIGTVVIFMLLR